MPCPKGIELEAGHRQLGDLKTLSIPSRLLDCTAELLDGLVVKLLKDIKAGDHLVVKEGFSSPLAEEVNMLEHAICVLTNSCLDNPVFGFFGIIVVAPFIIISRIGLFVGVDATIVPSLRRASSMSTSAQGLSGFC
jgi:hypothetical protein